MTSSEWFLITQPVMFSKKLREERNASEQANAGAAVAAPRSQVLPRLGIPLFDVCAVRTGNPHCGHNCRMQSHIFKG